MMAAAALSMLGVNLALCGREIGDAYLQLSTYAQSPLFTSDSQSHFVRDFTGDSWRPLLVVSARSAHISPLHASEPPEQTSPE
jgi:hypothetical protein